MKKVLWILIFLFLITLLGLGIALVTILSLKDSIDDMASNVSGYVYDDSESYSVGNVDLNNKINEIDIDWIAGNVYVELHDNNYISISENSKSELNDDLRLRYLVEGSSLYIKNHKSGLKNLTSEAKDLYVKIPSSLSLEDISVDSTSANITLSGIEAENAEVNSVSGAIKLDACNITDKAHFENISGKTYVTINCPIREVECNTVSGNIEINAESILDSDFDSISGDIRIKAINGIHSLDAESVSGSITLDLPSDSSCEIEFESGSGRFSSDIPTTVKGDKYIINGGGLSYDISTVSGNVFIR